MNIRKTEHWLNKIQSLFNAIKESPHAVSSIQRDLFLKYLRDLYEEITQEDSKHELVQTPKPEIVITELGEIFPSTEESTQLSTTQTEDNSNLVKSTGELTPAREMGSEEMLVANSVQGLFKISEGLEISERLSMSPIKDIFSTMSINERIQTMNELFRGNEQEFKNTLHHIDHLTTYDQASKYLVEGVATENHWDDEAVKDTAAQFVQLVYRKFQ